MGRLHSSTYKNHDWATTTKDAMNAFLQQFTDRVLSIASLEDFDNTCELHLHSFQEKLQLPSYAHVVQVVSAAYHDTLQAFRSCGALIVLVGRPMFLLLRMILTPLLNRLWWLLVKGATFVGHVAVPWINRHGGRHLRSLARRVYDYHAQRSSSELALEVAGAVLLYGAWRLYQHVKTHRWVSRAQALIMRPIVRALECYRRILIQLQQSYQQLVAQVAAVSNTCALALPHVLYFSFAALVSHPTIMGRTSFGAAATEYLATQTPLIPLLQVGYPLWETLTCILLIEKSLAEQGRRRNLEQKQHQERQLGQLQCVLDYWTLYAALQIAGALLTSIPVISYYLLQSTALQVARLWFSLWMSGLLYLAVHYSHTLHTTTIHNSNNPHRNPIFQWVADGLVDHVGDQILHGVVPRSTWQRLLLNPVAPLLDLAVTIKILTPLWRDKLLHVLAEVRVLVIPLFLCFAPLVSVWSVRYAQYVMPLSKFATSTQRKLHRRANHATSTKGLLECAQYWALHIAMSCFVGFFLPLNILRFLAWWYLSWPTTIAWLWEWSEREMALGVDVLLGDATPTDSAVVRAMHAIVSRLPKAANAATDASSAPSDGQEQHAPEFDDIHMEDSRGSDPLNAGNDPTPSEKEEEEHFASTRVATPPSAALRRSQRIQRTRATT